MRAKKIKTSINSPYYIFEVPLEKWEKKELGKIKEIEGKKVLLIAMEDNREKRMVIEMWKILKKEEIN